MAFPTIEGFQETLDQVATETPTLDLPAGVQAGDEILVAVSGYSGAGVISYTAPSGWEKVEDANQTNLVCCALFRKTATGGETTISPESSRVGSHAAHAYIVRGAEEFEIAAPEVLAGAAGNAAITAPALSPSWGSGESLFMVFGFNGRVGVEFGTMPAGYTSQTHVGEQDGGGFSTGIASGYRESTSATESPGDLVSATYKAMIAMTLAFRATGTPPSVTLDQSTLTPGSTISGTCTDYSAAPTSPITVSDGTNTDNVTVSITDEGGGEYTFVGTMPASPTVAEGSVTVTVGEASAAATYEYPSVAGLPSYTLRKDGVTLGSLTGVKCLVTATGELDGTEIYSANNLTTTNGVLPEVDLSATSANVGDTVTVSILTGDNEGITFQTTVADIA